MKKSKKAANFYSDLHHQQGFLKRFRTRPVRTGERLCLRAAGALQQAPCPVPHPSEARNGPARAGAPCAVRGRPSTSSTIVYGLTRGTSASCTRGFSRVAVSTNVLSRLPLSRERSAERTRPASSRAVRAAERILRCGKPGGGACGLRTRRLDESYR